MKNKSKLNKISIVLIFTLLVQLLVVNIAAAYPSTNVSGKPLNDAMSKKAGFGIYGIESNGTGVKAGVVPSGMQVPQEQKENEWRYLGYNFDDKIISNPSFPGDYSGPGGVKIGGKAYTWGTLKDTDYSRVTPATNADSGDTQSANQIGIDYCELLEPARVDKPGAFRVWFKVPPYPGYPNGRTMYMTYIIPKNDAVNRYSFIYYRIDGTSTSLLPGGALYEKTEYPLRPGTTAPITATAKNFEGYEFTRSITGASTSGGFGNELTGEAGKTRTGSVSYSSTNEFDVVFYYKKIEAPKKLNIKHVSYDPITKAETTFEEYSTNIGKKDAYLDAAKEYPGYKYLQYQHGSSGYSSGTISTDTLFPFTFDDFGNSNEYYVKFMYVKDINATLTGQILTDKPSYSVKSTDTTLTIQAKEQTDVNVTDATDIQEIGAKIVSYSINGGAETTINKIKTGSSIKTISTDYAPINLTVSSLKDGNNIVTIKGYSWFKDKLGTIKEVNTSKTISVFKTATSKPVATIDAPTSAHVGNTVEVKGSGSDPAGIAITEYQWTTSNGQTLTGTGGSIKVDAPVTLTLKVKNSLGVWSDPVTHTINTENEPPTAQIIVPPTVLMGDDVNVLGIAQDNDGDPLEYYWNTPSGMNGTLEGNSGTVYFMDLGIKNFGLTVIDPSGESASATAQTEVIAPYPSVNIQAKGTLKENRKVTLDGTASTGGSKRVLLDWTKAKWEVTAISGGTAADIKTASSYNGSKSMDFVFKKPGTYKAKLTLTNTLGLSKTEEKIFVIEEDKAPIADFTFVKNVIRDPKDPSSSGLAQGTYTITDLSKSEDNDSIVKRAYFVTFDSDNDGDWDEEMCYVYDLDSTATKQMPYNDSDNLHLRPIGLYKNFATFDIANINTGNLTEFKFKFTHVGRYLFDVNVKEEFGQPTIDQFVTPGDRKTGTTYE